MNMLKYLVTGGSSGIGQALAWQLAKRGYQVYICGRRAALLEQTKAEYPEQIHYVVGDLTDQVTIDRLAQALNGEKLAGLIQNAAVLPPLASIETMKMDEYWSHQQINVGVPIRLFKHFRQQLSGGRVLHLSSFMAHHPAHSWGAYCISKASLYMLLQVLRQECSDIAFGSVMPGVTDTDMQSQIRQSSNLPESNRSYFQSLHDDEKLLSPEVVANFLAYLLLQTTEAQFVSQEWDIYDKSHHPHWENSINVQEI
jgi:NAD(P)-dependent dehydrogenase (short-subunit alcohol dehydrogenase family)